MTGKSRVSAVINWLRAGYPTGVPGPDRVPLLALLRNTPLTEDQVKEVVREIVAVEATAPAGHLIDHDEIEKFIDKWKDNIGTVAIEYDDDEELMELLEDYMIPRICNVGDMQFPDFFEQYDAVDDFNIYVSDDMETDGLI